MRAGRGAAGTDPAHHDYHNSRGPRFEALFKAFSRARARERPVLVFRGVSRRYGRARALDDVSFELPKGSLVALLGANGAGKSTLLRIAATLDRPTSGELRVGGADPREEGAAARAHVAYLGQEPGLYGDLSVRENLAFVARFHGRESFIEHAADACGVARKLDERARSLSRGERQRAALARALCGGTLLLLDEPTTALDAVGRSAILDVLASVRGTRTMLVATHDEHLLGVADRALVLERGRLVLDGTPDDGRRWMEALA